MARKQPPSPLVAAADLATVLVRLAAQIRSFWSVRR